MSDLGKVKVFFTLFVVSFLPSSYAQFDDIARAIRRANEPIEDGLGVLQRNLDDVPLNQRSKTHLIDRFENIIVDLLDESSALHRILQENTDEYSLDRVFQEVFYQGGHIKTVKSIDDLTPQNIKSLFQDGIYFIREVDSVQLELFEFHKKPRIIMAASNNYPELMGGQIIPNSLLNDFDAIGNSIRIDSKDDFLQELRFAKNKGERPIVIAHNQTGQINFPDQRISLNELDEFSPVIISCKTHQIPEMRTCSTGDLILKHVIGALQKSLDEHSLKVANVREGQQLLRKEVVSLLANKNQLLTAEFVDLEKKAYLLKRLAYLLDDQDLDNLPIGFLDIFTENYGQLVLATNDSRYEIVSLTAKVTGSITILTVSSLANYDED